MLFCGRKEAEEGKEREGEAQNRGEQLSLLRRDDRDQPEARATQTLDENLDKEVLDRGKEHGGADQVWTWNAPEFLTGDRYGTRPEYKSRETGQPDKPAGADNRDKIPLKEKVEKLNA